MAVPIMLLLILVLVVSVGFAVAQVLALQGQLREHAVVADFEKRKELLRAEMQTVEDTTERLRAKSTDYERKIASSEREYEQKLAAIQQRLAPGARALDLQQTTERLATDVRDAEQKLADLRKELESVEEAREIQSFGLYRARYSLSSSLEYETRLEQERGKQKELIKGDKAAHCPTTWQVDGSAAKGKKMIGEHAKLMLRALSLIHI